MEMTRQEWKKYALRQAIEVEMQQRRIDNLREHLSCLEIENRNQGDHIIVLMHKNKMSELGMLVEIPKE